MTHEPPNTENMSQATATHAKDEAIEDWCKRVSDRTGQRWIFLRANQSDFDKDKPTTLDEAAAPRKRAALL